MKFLDRDQHSVCKVEGHHSPDGFDNNPNRLCSVQSSCEVVLELPPSPSKTRTRLLLLLGHVWLVCSIWFLLAFSWLEKTIWRVTRADAVSLRSVLETAEPCCSYPKYAVAQRCEAKWERTLLSLRTVQPAPRHSGSESLKCELRREQARRKAHICLLFLIWHKISLLDNDDMLSFWASNRAIQRARIVFGRNIIGNYSLKKGRFLN